MPRGWQKHASKHFGSKIRRGGSSHNENRKYLTVQRALEYGRKLKACHRIDDEVMDYYDSAYFFDEYYDEEEYDQVDDNESDSIETSTQSSRKEEYCPICCEVTSEPLFNLMRNCNHPPACKSCYQKIYVTEAQKDVSNYPLTCFFPSCNIHVALSQLERHGLVKNDKERRKHQHLSAMASAYQKPDKYKLANCPKCDCGNLVRYQQKMHCRACSTMFIVLHDDKTQKESTIAVMEEMEQDKFGLNDGWAECPRCKLLISKGFGCDHMICVCGHDFSWRFALDRRQRNYGVTRTSTATANAQRLSA